MRSDTTKSIESFDAGAPSLTFVNWARLGGIRDYSELVACAAGLGLVEAGRDVLLQKLAQTSPFRARADEAVAEARILARVIQRIFTAVAESKTPRSSDLDFLSDALGKAMAHLALASTGPSGSNAYEWAYEWAWRDDHEADLDCMLWPVARDAAELLVGQDPARIRLCEGRDCARLYLDKSKAGRRRWCQMDTCGNRAKARRFAARHSEPKVSLG